MPDISSIPTEQLQAMLQSHSEAPVTAKPDISSISTEDLQKMADAHASATPTNLPSKALAATGSFTAGALEGAGSVAKALPNIGASLIEKGLNYLNEQGIVPDSISQGFAKGRAGVNQAMDTVGNRIMSLQKQAAAPDVAANPTISKVGNIAGNIAGSTAVTGGLLGKVGTSLSAVNAGALSLGAQGVLTGAATNPENPIKGAIEGGILGVATGGIAGRLSRKAEIINDKIDEAAKVGYGPLSQQGQASIKQALENNGQDLSKEELQQQVKNVITQKLEAVAPKVDLQASPTDTIASLAKANFAEVKATKNALYAPLNDSTAVAPTPILANALSSVRSTAAKDLLPDALPANPTISDLMAYRRQAAAGIDQATRAVKNGTGDFRAIDELNKVKSAVTDDLNTAASKAGIGDQLAKADAFHKNNYLPFQIYNKSGQLTSEKDATKAWTVINRALMTPRPNLEKITEISKTLGPQGKEIVGHAYLQQAVKNAVDLDGKIKVSTIATKFNRLENSGLADQILTPELREAFNGMKIIADGANKIMKGSDKPAKGAIMNMLDGLTHSAGGIMILRGLGSKTTAPAKIKNAIGKLLTTGAVQQVAAPEENP